MQFELGRVHVRQRSRIPHWDVEHGIYFVTWHLADAIPAEERQSVEERCEWYASLIELRAGPVAAAHLELIRRFKRRLMNRTLDLNLGSCVLRGDAAAVVANALLYFDNVKYDLYAWCVMPNHVHVVFSRNPDYSLDQVLHSWKSFTSKRVNEIVGRSGNLWIPDYFDTAMRNTRQFERTIQYVLSNPEKSGLVEWPYRPSYPERIARVIA